MAMARFSGFSSHFWLPLGIGIVMKVSRENWFYPQERDDLPKNRDLIDIVWLLLNKCGSDWWSYPKMSFNEWFSELLLTKHGTWSLIHVNGMIYQQLNMVISRKKMWWYNESATIISQTISMWVCLEISWNGVCHQITLFMRKLMIMPSIVV